MKHNKFSKTHYIYLAILLLSVTKVSGQEIKSILSSGTNYDEIVEDADQYFKAKYPGKSFDELGRGEFRDGSFVKYQRWKAFWGNRLNPDRTLGDLSAYWRSSAAQLKSSGPYSHIPWSNISNENFITIQIGLGRTTAMAFHPTNPDIFYIAAAMGGIWKTTDGGQNYTPLGDELPLLSVSSIVLDQNNPNTLYIGISDHVWYGTPSIGVYKSTDGGSTWSPTALSFEFSENIRIYWMEADPFNPNKIITATRDGLYLTNDGFTTISKVDNSNCYEARFKPDDSNIIYVTTNDGRFLRSNNGGNTFSQITDFGNDATRMAVSSLNTQKVLVQNGSQFFESSDAGLSFAPGKALPESNLVLTYDPLNTNTIITGNFETYRSDDAGDSFYQTSSWLNSGGLPLVHVDQRNIFVNPLESDFVYYCNDGGLFRYIISTNEFEDLSDGLSITQFYDIAVSQTNPNIIGGGSQDNGNMYRDANGVWQAYAETGDGMNQQIDPTDENIRYWAYQNGALRRWQNGSNSNISPPGEDGQGAWETPYKLDPNNPNRIIAGYTQVYESLDRGASWVSISDQLTGKLDQMAIAPSNSNRIYVVDNKTLFVKDINANDWTQINSIVPKSITDIEVDPLDMNTLYVSVSGYQDNNKVFKSTDAGQNWTNISGSLPNVPASAIETYDSRPGGLFVGTDAGVFYTEDGLDEWFEYGELPHTRVKDIEIQYSANLIRIGTHGRGVFEAAINVNVCADPTDSDNDGTCDTFDSCPNFDNTLFGSPCDDGDTYTSGETFTPNCGCENGLLNLNYCDAQGGAGTGSDWINNVRINTIDNPSGKDYYSNFTNISTTLNRSSSHELEVQLNYVFGPDSVFAWVDWDRNQVFAADEAVDMSQLVNNKSQGTVEVPSDALLGSIAMRVRVVYAGSHTADPCNNYFGEVEDYRLIIDAECINLNLKTMLEGPFDANINQMTTALANQRKILPGQTPVSNISSPTPPGNPYTISPWSHTGNEGIDFSDSDYDNNVVDWVLVSLRTDIHKADQAAQTAALLYKDGSIQTVIPCIEASSDGPFYIVIEHRNHMGIMSPLPVNLVNNELNFDFTTQDSYVQPGGVGQKLLAPGIWGMFAGDIDQTDAGSYDIIGTDKAIWNEDNGNFDMYIPSDTNLDGDINGNDKSIWFENNGNSSRVPK